MKRVMVRYKVKPDQVETNEALVRDVYEELRRNAPTVSATRRSSSTTASLRPCRAEHGEPNPLVAVDAFQRFPAGVRAAVTNRPSRSRSSRSARTASPRRILGDERRGNERPTRGSLKTPPQTSDYEMHLDERDGQSVIVCVVGKTTLLYDARAIDDLHAMLGRTATGSSSAAPTSRSRRRKERSRPGADRDNPVGGWYGLKKGLRGRFGMYMPPLLEELGKAEVEHNPRNNRMRALG